MKSFFLAGAVFTAGVQVVSATFIRSCPATQSSCVVSGSQYSICPGADYSGTTLWDYHNVPDANTCAQYCQKYTGGCTAAVWDNIGLTCHIKGPMSGLTWVGNPWSTTITFTKTGPPAGTALDSCPYDVQSGVTPQGWHFQVCPGTDYIGTTTWATHNLGSDQECANACANAVGCYKAVYDTVGKTCHFKTTDGLQLVSNPIFDTIKFLDRPGLVSTTTSSSTTRCTTTTAAGAISTTKPTTLATSTTTRSSTTVVTTTASTTTPVTTTTTSPTTTGPCLNGAGPDYTYTSPVNNAVYGVCKNTDFPGGDMQPSPIYNVATIEACADLCSQTPGCVAGNLHKSANICYLKSSKNAAAANSGVDGTYLISALGGSSGTQMGGGNGVPTTTTTAPTCAAVTVTATQTVTVTKY